MLPPIRTEERLRPPICTEEPEEPENAVSARATALTDDVERRRRPNRTEEPQEPEEPEGAVKARPSALTDDVERLRRKIVAAGLAVHRVLGPGYRESVYQKCLCYELRRRGHAVQEQVVLDVVYEELIIEHAGRADVIVDGLIVVEVKATQEMHPVFGTQVISYLKATGLSLGIVLNFGSQYLLRGGYDKFLHPDILAEQKKTPRTVSSGSSGS